MNIAAAHTIIMFAVRRKPSDFTLDIFSTDVAFDAHDFPVGQKFQLVIEFPRNVLHIIVKHNADFLFFGFRGCE